MRKWDKRGENRREKKIKEKGVDEIRGKETRWVDTKERKVEVEKRGGREKYEDYG